MTMTRDRISALDRAVLWTPQPGPQLDAFLSPADQLLLGGAAGGGKSDAGIGLALTLHRSTLYVRREGVQLQPVIDRITELVGSREGFNSQAGVWRLPGGRTIRLGGCPQLGDEAKYQGAARDLLVVDEAANFLEEQVRFLLGWVRSTVKGQRCRAFFASNPPSGPEGEWIVRWWSPWLDENHPNPARPGELRWIAMLDGKEVWVSGPEPIHHKGEVIRPVSRTFIPSRVTDNAYLRDTGYLQTLQALPEPLRSMLLHGSFTAGRADNEWQVIPTAWVKAAMDRWTEPDLTQEITSVGVDPSRGGDETIIAVRRRWAFDPLIAVPPDVAAHGGTVAQKVLSVAGPTAPMHIDCIGIGVSVLDHVEAFAGSRAVPVNFSSSSDAMDATNNLRFVNKRAECWWAMRELLDPTRSVKVSLPRDHQLLADLAAPRYRVTARGIQIEDKAEIKRRLGRSPDRGDAVVLASIRTPVFRSAGSGLPFAVRRSTPSSY